MVRTMCFRLHNRVTEKMLVVLLKKGYSLRNSKKEKAEYVRNIEDLVNNSILGSEHSGTGFRIPLTHDESDIATNIYLSDTQAKHIMCNINLILARTFNDTFQTEIDVLMNKIHIHNK